MLFDHLAGLRKKAWGDGYAEGLGCPEVGEHACRNGEAERLSGRTVDDELEFGRLQYRLTLLTHFSPSAPVTRELHQYPYRASKYRQRWTGWVVLPIFLSTKARL